MTLGKRFHHFAFRLTERAVSIFGLRSEGSPKVETSPKVADVVKYSRFAPLEPPPGLIRRPSMLRFGAQFRGDAPGRTGS